MLFALALVVAAALAVAAESAKRAHRRSRAEGNAWYEEYGEDGMGLSIERALLVVVTACAIAMAVILDDGFRTLFLEDAWRTHWWAYLVVAVAGAAGVLYYHLWSAPRSLAKEHGLDDKDEAWRQCGRPYLVYTPYSFVLAVVLVLPVLATVVFSAQSDYRAMVAARDDLAESGAAASSLIVATPETDEERLALYALGYQAAVDSVQHSVARYLWVVGIFILFLIVILNTKITLAFADTAQDIFKWMMFGFLALAFVICLVGLHAHDAMQELAASTYEEIVSEATSEDRLGLAAVAQEELLEVRAEGPSRILRGGAIGILSLVLFGNAFQFLIARATNRSAVDAIFPRSVARFLHRFLLVGDQPRT